MTDEWVPLSVGNDQDEVKRAAAARLAEMGVLLSELGDDEVQLNVGLETGGHGYFQVAVLKSVIEEARTPRHGGSE